MNKLISAGLAAVTIVAVSACSAGAGPKGSDSAPAGDNRPTTAATAAASPTSKSSANSIKPFGSTFTWDDNLSVTVSEPENYEPGAYAAGKEGFDKFVIVQVTIVNKTGDMFDPTLFTAKMQSANKDGAQIFDSANGLTGTPSTQLLDGREATFKLAYGVADPNDLVLQVSPDFKRKPGFFQKKA